MQNKTNTVRIEPYDYAPPVDAANFRPRLTLVHSRASENFEIAPYRPVSRLARWVIIILATAASTVTLGGVAALMVV